MNLKDESIYYLKRLFIRKKLEARRRKHIYNEFQAYKFIFVHIPKNAGISIVHALIGKPVKHTSALNYRAVFGKSNFDQYYKFSFVRNPFTRLVSAYEFLQNGGYGTFDKNFADAVKKYETLEDLVLNFLNPQTIQEMPHFRPQHWFICDSSGKLLIDYVGRFERINEDYEVIRNKVGIGEPLKKLNTTNSNRKDIGSYYTNPKVIEKVVRLYKKDFELFGYSKELPSA